MIGVADENILLLALKGCVHISTLGLAFVLGFFFNLCSCCRDGTGFGQKQYTIFLSCFFLFILL